APARHESPASQTLTSSHSCQHRSKENGSRSTATALLSIALLSTVYCLPFTPAASGETAQTPSTPSPSRRAIRSRVRNPSAAHAPPAVHAAMPAPPPYTLQMRPPPGSHRG